MFWASDFGFQGAGLSGQGCEVLGCRASVQDVVFGLITQQRLSSGILHFPLSLNP